LDGVRAGGRKDQMLNRKACFLHPFASGDVPAADMRLQ
jgi:hypothetical protein